MKESIFYLCRKEGLNFIFSDFIIFFKIFVDTDLFESEIKMYYFMDNFVFDIC